ncbi:ThiF family adenylyltransferase [Minwuia sp. IMCC3060]|uniref:HesA/MoeB/ThiF family protein n=1 Tax=Minwuia sp. IMCC3060 TaxID=3040675 RepID=UPI00247985CC|nr:ThiF family adenylyltransferase [Minwuia sp. IMCC3060]
MESDRYQRHSLIEWFSQEEINALNVCVVGAGAVGNEIVKNLALLGVGNIDVFDFDTIERHNLTRSVLFRENDIGRAKAEVVAERARKLDPNLNIRPYLGDFWELLGPIDFQRFDVVFCCVDNFEARLKLNRLCYLTSTDLVNVGIDSRFSSVEVYPFKAKPETTCYECAIPDSVYTRISERYSCGWLKKVSFIEKKIPTTIVTSSVGASIATSLGLRLGKTGNEPTQAIRILIDTISGHSQRSMLTKKELCPCCGIHSIPLAVIPASSDIRDRFETTLPDEISEVMVWTAEPILAGYTDMSGGSSEQFHSVFEVASNFDDRFAKTVSDKPDDILIDIRDQFDLAELESHFSNLRLPGRFAVVGNATSTLVLDFGGTKDV